MGALDGEKALEAVMEGANAILIFEDENGNDWTAAAVMTPLQRGGEFVNVAQMPDRAFRLKGFRVVIG